MTVDILRRVLGWCAVINMGLLLWWFLFFVFAHDWIYRRHSRWFKIPVETFDAIHYTGIAFLKIAILVFNIIPYFALLIVT
ncbi:MAG: hypothetical protein ISS45_08510 [Candidatus Omnitrophica bacterium]|nr:hypothetical protein [Candidatus Omnitrophota bacterium]